VSQVALASMCVLLVGAAWAAATAGGAESAAGATGANRYARWENGPPKSKDYFPIAVWLQDPRNAARYKQAGINLYVGLWKGPTEKQLAELKAAGMQVICAQNAVGLKHRDDPVIVGWMHGDEPDNAQPRRGGGYGPPIPPERIVANYEKIKAADPTRPVLLNLGQGVAWDGWRGRGVRTNHPEDYPQYVRGCDIASFDIYPVVHPSKQIAGKLWYVARGVERLNRWAGPRRVVWNCIECTHISSPRKPTPRQVKAEVWMSLIHGSQGLIYFVHQFKPTFNEHALLDDPEMLAAVTAINRQIKELAPALNGPALPDAVKVASSDPSVPVAATARRSEGWLYVFSVAMREGATEATFTLSGPPAASEVTAIGEGRTLPLRDGRFTDRFAPYDVHLYRVQVGEGA